VSAWTLQRRHAREVAREGIHRSRSLARSAAEEPGPPIELRPIGPQPFTWPVALVWRARRRQPPAAKAFLALAIARAEEAPAVRLVA
jgi:DNA-binding transcriptional LysR family regulator